jgi:MFS family permease
MSHDANSRQPVTLTAGQRAGDSSFPRLSRLMAVEGGFQSAMTQLTSDVLLTAFALALGAGPIHIGLLATLPLGLRLSQLFTSTRVGRLGRWRSVALLGGAAGRVALFGGLAAAFMDPGDGRVWLLVAVVTAAAIGGSLYDLAIVAWMAELVPMRLRGEFFGRRNRAIAAVGLAVTLGAALIIDSLRGEDAAVLAFAIIFAAGAAIGLLGLVVLARAPRGPRHDSLDGTPPVRVWMREAFADRSFYRLARFGLIWGFAVNFASPFFAVYQIQVLALPLTAVTLFKAVTTAATMASSSYWGRMVDHFGAKPVARAGTFMVAVVPLLWLFVTPGRVWPLVFIQLVSGVAFAAYDGNINNLVLKLAPPERRARCLAAFGAAYGVGSVAAPVLGGAVLWSVQSSAPGGTHAFAVLFVLGAILRLLGAAQLRGVHEPGGVSVGRMIRVMGRFRAMTVEFPFEPFLHYVYLPAARVADYLAPERGGQRSRRRSTDRDQAPPHPGDN